MKLYELTEAFSDMGKLSDDQLDKSNTEIAPLTFKQVDGRIFHKAITRIRQNDMAKGNHAKGLESLTVYSASDYQKAACFLGSNNACGYAIKSGNELVSVFSANSGAGRAIMASANQNGANNLDCFATRSEDGSLSGPLYSLYSKAGYRVDKSKNEGTAGEPYAIVNGVSSFVDDAGQVHNDDPRVVIFMRR